MFADVFALRIQSFCVGVLHGHGAKLIFGVDCVHAVADYADFLHFVIAGAVRREFNLVFYSFGDFGDGNFVGKTTFEVQKICFITETFFIWSEFLIAPTIQ